MDNYLKEQIVSLPINPGIYKFYDDQNKLLYIGKAANLKRRVSSYFHKTLPDPSKTKLVSQIFRIAYTETDSVIEALILEANEINKHQPPYNLRLKDDKSFVIIGITKEIFPAVIITRPTQKLKIPLHYQFGPYPSADQARTALKIIRKILPFRTTCAIPKNFPLSSFHSTSGNSQMENHELIQRGCLDYQIGLCPGTCVGIITPKEYVKLIGRVKLFLEGKKPLLRRRLEREMKQAAKLCDYEKASKLRNQLFALQHIQDVALIRDEADSERQTSFDGAKEDESASGITRRIEAYDISNLGADYAVGSMVVLTNGKPDNAEYRKFRIKTVVGQNDLQMMEEVLTRRFRHSEWPLPTLIVIDGGAQHLKIAERVIKQARLIIPIIAAAKGPNRDRLDLYLSDYRIQITEYRLRTLLRQARDEAHRFAISYHRSRRDQTFHLK